MPANQNSDAPRPVLLYDGECGLCQRVVWLLLRADRRGTLRFAPLQGQPAQQFLAANGLPTEDFSSLVFVPDWPHGAGGKYKLRTDGAIAAVRSIGRGALLMTIASWIPRGWRDALYHIVARVRSRIFGPAPEGLLDRPGWRQRFVT